MKDFILNSLPEDSYFANFIVNIEFLFKEKLYIEQYLRIHRSKEIRRACSHYLDDIKELQRKVKSLEGDE